MITTRFLKNIPVRPVDEKNFRLLFLHSILSGFGVSYLLIFIYPVFVAKTHSQSWPLTFILIGFIGYLLNLLIKKLRLKFSSAYIHKAIFVIYALLAFAFYWSVIHHPIPVKYIAIIGFSIFISLLHIQSLSLIAVCDNIFNVQQRGRIIIILTATEIFSAIAAYLVMLLLFLYSDSIDLYILVSYFIILAALWPLSKLSIINKTQVDVTGQAMNNVRTSTNFSIKNKLYLFAVLVSICSVMAIYIVEYSFLFSVWAAANSGDTNIIQILALYFIIIRSGELYALYFSENFIRSQGLKRSLLLLPVILIISSFFGGISLAGFNLGLFAAINKSCVQVIRKEVLTPVMNSIFRIVGPIKSMQLQSKRDANITLLATVLAGILLLAIPGVEDINTAFFALYCTVIFLIFFTMWIWFSRRLFKNYKQKIKEYLNPVDAVHDKISGGPYVSEAVPSIEVAINIAKENYDAASLEEKLQTLMSLNKNKYKLRQKDVVFFNDISKEALSDILWLEICLNNEDYKPNILQTDLLKNQLQTLKMLFFEILKMLYSMPSNEVLEKIWANRDQLGEDELFNIELMGSYLAPNINDTQVNEVLAPVTDDGSKFSNKEMRKALINALVPISAD